MPFDINLIFTYVILKTLTIIHHFTIHHFTIAGDFPLRFCYVPCHTKSRNNKWIWNFEITDEIFPILDFLQKETYSVLYYNYSYYCNPNYISWYIMDYYGVVSNFMFVDYQSRLIYKKAMVKFDRTQYT